MACLVYSPQSYGNTLSEKAFSLQPRQREVKWRVDFLSASCKSFNHGPPVQMDSVARHPSSVYSLDRPISTGSEMRTPKQARSLCGRWIRPAHLAGVGLASATSQRAQQANYRAMQMSAHLKLSELPRLAQKLNCHHIDYDDARTRQSSTQRLRDSHPGPLLTPKEGTDNALRSSGEPEASASLLLGVKS